MIHGGVFYKCMRPPTTREYLENRGACQTLPDFATVDGVPLCSSNLLARLQTYMQDDTALQSCQYCLLGFLKGFYEPYSEPAYTRMKNSLREIPYLRDFVRSAPVVSDLFHILDPVLSPPQGAQDRRVPILPHVNMSRQECEPIRLEPSASHAQVVSRN